MIIDQQLRQQRHYNFPEVYESNPFEKSVSNRGYISFYTASREKGAKTTLTRLKLSLTLFQRRLNSYWIDSIYVATLMRLSRCQLSLFCIGFTTDTYKIRLTMCKALTRQQSRVFAIFRRRKTINSNNSEIYESKQKGQGKPDAIRFWHLILQEPHHFTIFAQIRQQ